jgi:hypothetical protein
MMMGGSLTVFTGRESFKGGFMSTVWRFDEVEFDDGVDLS